MDQPDLGADPRARTSAGRRRLRLGGRFLRPLERRNDGLRQRHLGKRADVRGARRLDRAWPDVHAGRRCAWRRIGWRGGGHQLRLLAAAIRRRGRRGRPPPDDPPCSLHDCRHHGAGILRARCRPLLRCRHPDRHGTAAPRLGEFSRRPIDLVAEHHGPYEARPDRRAGDRDAARPPAADSAGDNASPAPTSPTCCWRARSRAATS